MSIISETNTRIGSSSATAGFQTATVTATPTTAEGASSDWARVGVVGTGNDVFNHHHHHNRRSGYGGGERGADCCIDDSDDSSSHN